MCQKHFTHLHLHTDYSLLDGAIPIDKLIKYGKDNNLKALAISDHGNIFGAVKFFEKCKKANIKPILGIEAYITEDIGIKNIHNRYYHLLLIVQNSVGYKNICRLISESYTKGFYFKPRIDYALLKKYNEGIIATSTCIGGHIPQLLLQNQNDEAKAVLEKLLLTFENRYYLEVQPPYLESQKIVNQEIFKLESEFNIPVVLTGDCHYTTKEDRFAHEVMLAVQTRTTMSDPQRMTFGDSQCHIQGFDELLSHFPTREDMLWRSGEIADRCEFTFDVGKLFFPQYQIPIEKMNANEYFEHLSKKGFNDLEIRNKIPLEKIAEYKTRLEEEVNMIIKMGFATYLLIVSDFILWAKENNIAVGPGRGSVAGSLVAWALSITDIDPIKYNLFFERFLNPERISMPDIDVDFCFHGREKVINYVKNKYGHDKVGQIITFGTMMSKGVVKDVARALGFTFEDANMITGLIPDELKITLAESINQEPKLQQLIDQNPKIAELFDIASRLEGLTRHASKHAAGIVISPEPIAEVLPIYVPTKSTDIVTQYAMTELELLGFLKIDFLGLKNLTLITNIVDLIKKNNNINIVISDLDLTDEKTFNLLQKGETAGVFQLESNGLKDVLRRLKPTCFEEIIAVNALYRPGPLSSGMVDDFIERKHGRQSINYFFNELEGILKDTYGVIVYQEQVMQIASKLAGYSLGESDILRRAMGKKKADEMAKQKDLFMARSIERGFEKNKTEQVFDLMAYFAGYGFNKAHSAAYALIAYQTAYLKAHYPIEFMSCLITLELAHPENTLEYIKYVKESNIKLLPPDINISISEFIPENNGIRWGLLGIKNVGLIAAEDILKKRKEEGDYKDLFDLCNRVDLRVCNKRVLESLIASGALDCFKQTRPFMMINLDYVMEMAHFLKEKKNSGQLSLFDGENQNEEESLEYKSADEWSLQQKLDSEKEVLGVYLSNHPLDEYRSIKKLYQCADIEGSIPNTNTKIIGLVIQFKEVKTKKGDLMSFAIIEDQNKRCELILFPKIHERFFHIIEKKSAVLVFGDSTESTPDLLKIKVSHVIDLQKFSIEHVKEFTIKIFEDTDLSLIQEEHSKLPPGTQTINFSIDANHHTLYYTLDKKITITKNYINILQEKNILIYIE
jgi:DNA polymerase-3 subunit alpha